MKIKSNESAPAVSWIIVLLVLFGVSTVGISWLSLTARSSVQADSSSEFADSVSSGKRSEKLSVTLTTAILITSSCGMLVLGIFTMAQVRWRNRFQAGLVAQQAMRGKVSDLRTRLVSGNADREKLERELKNVREHFENSVSKQVESKTANLRHNIRSLERELTSYKKAAKCLTHEKISLNSSNDVLQLNVQASESALQRIQRLHELILNSAGDGIYGLDQAGNLAFVNPTAAKLTGWTAPELIGKSEASVFFKQSEDQEGSPGFEESDSGTIEGEFKRRNGSTFPVEYIRTAIVDKNRQIGAVVLFKDITEREKSRRALTQKADELQRSNQELERFAYVASHDLQEPLRKIRAFGDRLKAKFDQAKVEVGGEYLDRMQSAAARMQELIQDLLTFSRILQASRPFEPVDLNQIFKEVLSDLEIRIEQLGARFEIGNLPTLAADSTQMRQLFQNLLSNALKFHKPDSPPVVTVTDRIFEKTSASGETKQYCEITVQDNGIGFDEEYAERIFSVFQRLHGRSQYEGTGIGLSICRRIAERHHGTIMARSRANEGACFVITLPLTQR